MTVKIRFALCALLLLVLPCLGCSRQEKRPNIIFLMIDTLRADHLGVYGYERNTSPVIDRFARENLVFRWAITPAPWTPPSVASMLTGLYPSTHGMMPPNNRDIAKKRSTRLDEKLETLPERLKGLGYATGAVSTNPWISANFGYTQGFDYFEDIGRARAPKVHETAKNLIRKLRTSPHAPFFLYLHYMDVHDRGDNPEAFPDMFSGPIARSSYPEKMVKEIGEYDGEIRYVDTALGDFFAWLKAEGLYDDARIVLIADHGEQFMERGNHGHGFQLYNEEVHVPLIVKSGAAPQQIDHTVSTIDVFATVLDLAGAESPSNSFSFSLLRAHDPNARAGVFSEIKRIVQQHAFTSFEGRKLIKQFGDKLDRKDSTEAEPGEPRLIGLYDRRKDPHEFQAVTDDRAQESLHEHMQRIFTSILKIKVQAAEVDIQDDTLETLRSLGYAN